MEFPVVSCPAEFRVVADEFKNILGSHYKAFVAVLCGHLFGISSISDVVRFLLFSPSVSTIGRMFDDNKLYTQLNRRQKRRVLRLLNTMRKNPARYIFAIDDTLISHWGTNIWGAYHWSDHGKKTIGGHKLLVLGIVDTKNKVLIPIVWEILHRKDLNGKLVHEKDWEVALRLLDDAISFGFPTLPVVLDSGFSGNEFINTLIREDDRFVLEIKNNRIVIAHGKTRKIKESVAGFFLTLFRHKIFYLKRPKRPKWAVSAILQLKGLT